jgi:phage shock protein PspC (stress-responsive transcriptional regulator)
MGEPRPLRRVREDRMVAGVLGGLARHFELDVTLLRIVYVIATIFTAFFGVVLYLMAWIVIPEEQGEGTQR